MRTLSPSFFDSIFGVVAALSTIQSPTCSQPGATHSQSRPGDSRPDQGSCSLLEGIAPEDQVLLLAGIPLEDEVTLGQCGMEALSTLEVAGHMLGGKVHGFLDCAGQLTCQAPKEDKREKMKKAGQAKRCTQYNLCFVKVVPTFGKKSPSANS